MVRLMAASMLGFLVLTAGVPVPSINPEPSCRGAAARAKPLGDIEVCMRLEQAARDELIKRWDEFGADDKVTCVKLATAGGTPTYTELLTCLDMWRDARLLRENEGRGASRR